MKAVRIHGPGHVVVEEVPDPVMRESTDAILRVTATSICGTDLHLYNSGVAGGRRFDLTVGHEFVGIVEDVGSGVRTYRVGDRCVASMFAACGQCVVCASGQLTLCSNGGLFGFPRDGGGLQGGQAQFVRIPGADVTLTKIPDGVSDENALFTGDILATAYCGLRCGSLAHGETVGVVGAGPVGLMTVICALNIFGASRVFVADYVQDRLSIAALHGAVSVDLYDADMVDVVRDQTGGKGVDLAFEAAGNSESLAAAFALPVIGGRVVSVGYLRAEKFPILAAEGHERRLSVSFVTGDPYCCRAQLLSLVSAGRICPSSIISDRFLLSEAPAAYSAFDARKAVKVVLYP